VEGEGDGREEGWEGREEPNSKGRGGQGRGVQGRGDEMGGERVGGRPASCSWGGMDAPVICITVVYTSINKTTRTFNLEKNT
jgi:hypothetical protein